MFNGYCGEFFVINFITFVLSRFRDSLFAANHLLIWERILFDSMQKSSRFLIEIMTLALSANIMGIVVVFSVRWSHLCRLGKAKALKLTPGELHALLFPSLSRYFRII
jgi:hypothetical protein